MRGEALAKKLGWQFIDANPGLERYIGRSLNEILGKQGEEAFHQCEAEIISHYIGKDHKVSTPVQLERWLEGRSPLLPIADRKAFLDQQHLERDSLFEEVATLSIESISIEEDVRKIIKALED